MSRLLFSVGTTALLLGAAGAGAATADFLSSPAGARSAGMGETGTASAQGAEAVYWNPAALATLRAPELFLMREAGLASSSLNDAAFARPLGGRWGAGLSARYRTAGSLPQRDLFGAETGRLSPSDAALTAAAGRRTGRFSWGLAAKWVRSQIEGAAQTAAGDAGLLWKGGGSSFRWSGGLAVVNVGGSLRLGTAAEPLPRAWRAGLGASAGRLAFAVDGVKPDAGRAYVGAGAEAALARGPSGTFFLRGGYGTRSSEGGVSIGLGMGLARWRLDYAFRPYGASGDAHRLSLAWLLAPPARSPSAAEAPAKRPAARGAKVPSRPAAAPSSGGTPRPHRRRPGPQ